MRSPLAKIVKHLCRNRLHYRSFTRKHAGRTFSLDGQKYTYVYQWHNSTWLNERCVELAFGKEFLSDYAGRRILEIGNVLQNYFDCYHDVVDKYEKGPGVVNEDVVDYSSDDRFDLIISISTLEHVGWDEETRDPRKIPRALAHLNSLLKDDGLLVVTLPIGYNPHLDQALRDADIRFEHQYYLQRQTWDNQWTQVSWPSISHARYGAPFCNANALLIGLSTKEADGGRLVDQYRNGRRTPQAA